VKVGFAGRDNDEPEEQYYCAKLSPKAFEQLVEQLMAVASVAGGIFGYSLGVISVGMFVLFLVTVGAILYCCKTKTRFG
jgi:hypothetical protein